MAFDSKTFNAEVFGKYMETVPRTKQNKFLEAGVLRPRNELKAMCRDQAGGNYITVPMFGLLGGDPVNYDGSTTITTTSTDTYSQSMVVIGRAKGWLERDFSEDITGADFWGNIAKQVGTYWDDVDQSTMLAILEGIYSMTQNDFTTKHTYDITGAATKTVDATSLNTATQKACGDNKDIFKSAIMHSAVATNLENLRLLDYLKYTDANGVQRDLALATWNGRTVLIDDSVPVTLTKTANGTAGVYTVTVDTALVSGDKIAITAGSSGKKEYEFTSGTTTKNAQATAIAALFSTDTVFTVTASSDTVVFTQKSNGVGIIPTVDNTESTTGEISVETTTAGVAPTYTPYYTTYVLGDGAFTFCDCGARVPYEMWRDPATHGGEEKLFTRQRKIFAPYGISFTKTVMSSLSPTDSELKNGYNWELVKSTSNTLIDHKAIPIARIISVG